MDIYFAFHIRWLQHCSGSWNMIKDKVNADDHYNVLQGWPFIERVSDVSLGKEWNQCEEEMFNLRNFCDKSTQKCDTRVYRIIAKNDWIVPYESIDSRYFKYLDDVFITYRGGHCGVTQCPETVSRIGLWNKQVLQSVHQ